MKSKLTSILKIISNTLLMKVLTFNQIQFRILTLIFLLFTSAVIGYRGFIERPQLKQTILKLTERELSTLQFSANNLFNGLSTLSYDYAVWSSTYEFMQNKNSDYLEENMIDDTFISLKIDGVFLIDENFEPIFTKGFDHIKKQEITFSFYDFKISPNNKNMLPTPIMTTGVPKKSGMILTQNGPAIFSAIQIRTSLKTGKNRGYLIFIKMFDQSVVDDLSKYTMTDISVTPITPQLKKLPLDDWLEIKPILNIKENRQFFLHDFNNQPILLLTVKHSNGVMPPLLDIQSLIFILLFSSLILIVYSLISFSLIRPVKSLADKIKSMGEVGHFKLLDEHYYIQELSKISRNFNALMYTVQHQNDLLSQQVFIDVLTQITNRRGFEDHLERQAQLCVRQGIGFTIIFADVDHFKNYNDALGHIEGDNALLKVAQTLNYHFKRNSDLCARYGGEEFIMLYCDMHRDNLDEKLQKILNSFEELNLPHPNSTTSNHVTVSMGACMISPSDVVNFKLPLRSIIRIADLALYQAKGNGRNQSVILNYSELLLTK